jgi:DNA-binding MarR family transcriptional regulator
MEDEGLLSRKKGTEDARQVIVSLTDKGKEMEEQAMNIPFQLLQKFSCTNLDQDQVAFLAPTLDSLIDTLK